MDACRKGDLEKSAIAEHVWKQDHPIMWEKTSAIDRTRKWKEKLLVKGVLHDQRVNTSI